MSKIRFLKRKCIFNVLDLMFWIILCWRKTQKKQTGKMTEKSCFGVGRKSECFFFAQWVFKENCKTLCVFGRGKRAFSSTQSVFGKIVLFCCFQESNKQHKNWGFSRYMGKPQKKPFVVKRVFLERGL